MNIGIAGPVALDIILDQKFSHNNLPGTFSFPPLSHYICACQEAGHTVHVFTLGDVTSTCVFRNSDLTVTVSPMRKHGRMRDFCRSERICLAEVMAASSCDIIHANWTYEFALAAQASGKPYLVTAHDAPFAILPYMRPLGYWTAHAFMSLPVLWRCRELAVISPYLEKYFKQFHIFRNPIHVVPEYVPNNGFEYFRNRSIPTAPTFVSTANGWGARKNISGLIVAFHVVRNQLPGSRLILFGSGHGIGEIGQLWAIEHGLSDGVEFAGTTPNSELLRRMAGEGDILVHPAREESFCVAIADAMAMGLPVIAGEKSGAVPWLLDHGKCGVLVDVNSPTAIAEAMIELAGNPEKCERLRAAARKRAEDTFRLDVVREQYIKLYKKIVGRGGGKTKRQKAGHR